MNSNMKKMFSLVATSLVVATSFVDAVDDMQMRNLENRVSALEQRRGSNGMINPPARPVVKDGADFWFQGEALYMQATEDGLGYAAKSATIKSYNNFRLKDFSYDWSWGFRAGVGYNLSHDGWDMLFNWTYFRANHHHHLHAKSGTSVTGINAVPASSTDIANADINKAEGHSHLRINLADLEMGREFFTSKWLTLRPHVGFRGAWIKRSFDSEYSGGATLETSEVEVDWWNRFEGFGLRGGVDSQWGLGSGWSFYGQLALALVYGRQHIRQTQEQETGSTETNQFLASDHWTTLRAMTDLGLGIRWDHLFSDDNYRIRLQFGWENHMFFGLNQNAVFPDDTVPATYVNKSGDLGLNGVSFQARFDF